MLFVLVSSARVTACPAGTYGATCSSCPAGFFCPPGIDEPSPCGDVGWFCPERSANRRRASIGAYTTPSSETMCEPGTFCEGGVQHACPVGKYGPIAGATNCTVCPPGHECSSLGSSEPTPLLGRYSAILGLSSRAAAPLCPRGSYCPRGSTAPIACPAGRYGAATGLETATCTALCPAGYWCVEGSIDPRPCETPLEFCSVGSAAPTATSVGYYTVGHSAERVCERGHYCADGVRRPCPRGTFGSREGLTECESPCAPGYVCPIASVRGNQEVCGNASVYCVLGERHRVGLGNYSATTSSSDIRYSQHVCEPGYFCDSDGVRRPCPAGTYGSRSGLSTPACSGDCPPGMYCVEASTEAVPTPPGVYCRGRCGSPDGDGLCASGYYCPMGSRTSTQRPCCDARRDDTTGLWYRYGNDTVDLISLVSRDGEEPPGLARDHDGWHQHDVYAPRCETIYCPAGTASPLAVSTGFYATGGNRTTRTAQAPCDTKSILLLGESRAPKCPSTTRHRTDDEEDVYFGTGLAGARATPSVSGGLAWDTPKYLGLGHYEWDDINDDDDDGGDDIPFFLHKHQRRLPLD